MKPAEDSRPLSGRSERLPAVRPPKSRDHELLMRVDWVDELFAAIDTRRR